MTILKKNRNTKTYKMIKIQTITNVSGRNEQSLQRIFHRCFLPSFSSFAQTVLEKKIFQKSTNQKQELPVAAMFVNRSGRNEQCVQRTFHRCFLSSFGSFGKVVSEEKIFYFIFRIDQSETRIACGGHVCKPIGNGKQCKYRVFTNLTKQYVIPKYLKWK